MNDIAQGNDGAQPSDDLHLESGVDELPPNIPPGFMGEVGPSLRTVDGDGPHGLNAGIIQEWTWETTIALVLLAYALCFPVAFVILWRSRKVPKAQKVAISLIMVAGIAYVAWKLLAAKSL